MTSLDKLVTPQSLTTNNLLLLYQAGPTWMEPGPTSTNQIAFFQKIIALEQFLQPPYSTSHFGMWNPTTWYRISWTISWASVSTECTRKTNEHPEMYTHR